MGTVFFLVLLQKNINVSFVSKDTEGHQRFSFEIQFFPRGELGPLKTPKRPHLKIYHRILKSFGYTIFVQ